MKSEHNDLISELAAAMKWPEFLKQGACVGTPDPRLFDDEDHKKTSVAKKICSKCPVQEQCAQWGIENEDSGIWGGMDGKDRAKARRGKRKFVSMEKRRENLEWLQDIWSDKPAADLAIKYGKTERTIYRWRDKERKRVHNLGWSPFRPS